MYRIVYTKKFWKTFDKLDNGIKLRFNKQIKILESNPYIGRPLKNNDFRELKVNKFRLYYVIRNYSVSVLLIDVSNKKNQQETIDFIYDDLRKYFDKFQ